MLLLPKDTGYGEQNLGYVQISAEELSSSKDEIIFKFSGHNLDRKDWFGRSDPFLEFYKSTESGIYSLIHRTEVGLPYLLSYE